jgi:c-di-GMP-binding flagellar brake protein YcgR
MGTRLKLISEPPQGDEESCYIDTALGVTSVLRSVATTRSRAAAYLGQGPAFMHTTLLAVENEPPMVVFERGADAALNQQMLGVAAVTLVTSDRGVPVQFTLATPVLADFEGVQAFRAPLPTRLLRLQRRSAYRLPGEPVHALLKCELARGDLDGRILKAPVIDVSCGGLSLGIPAVEPELLAGSQHACTLDIAALGRIETTIEVHESFDTTLPGDIEAKRYGVEFLNLEAKQAAIIQRYILEQERMKKKAR